MCLLGGWLLFMILRAWVFVLRHAYSMYKHVHDYTERAGFCVCVYVCVCVLVCFQKFILSGLELPSSCLETKQEPGLFVLFPALFFICCQRSHCVLWGSCMYSPLSVFIHPLWFSKLIEWEQYQEYCMKITKKVKRNKISRQIQVFF